MKYIITLEVDSETDIHDWVFEETLIIDEPYKVLRIEEA